MARRGAAAGALAGALRAPQSSERTDPFEAVVDALLDDLAERVALRLGVQHQQQHQEQEWLDVTAAAQYLACSKHRVYRLVHMRRMPFHKDGQRLLFDRAELDEWVRNGGAARVA